MNYLHALILGIVEGVTEFLPVSSTGHMIVTSQILKIPSTEFLKTFLIVIQLGAILAVFALYWRKLFASKKAFARVAVAFVPTAIIGLAFYKILKMYLLGNVNVVLWSLAIGGVIMIVAEKIFARRQKNEGGQNLDAISYKKAFWIGMCQAVALIPGVSRSGATIVGGMALGVSRAAIVEFSFLLAIPTMAAATGLDLVKSASLFSSADFGLLAVGLVTSFVVALIAIKSFLKYIQKHTFVGFGVYRIVFAAAVWGYLFLG